jgi:hypothetical protein
MRITFFVESVVGYVDNPTALLVRGLAHGLAQRGHDVRVVEERNNHALARTLRQAGAEPLRHFHDAFPELQRHTYEPRSGPPLLEWVSREIALIDVAVAVHGAETELCRWLANLTRERLPRIFLTLDPQRLDDEASARDAVPLFDAVFAPSQPAADLEWRLIPPCIATQDRDAGLLDGIDRRIALDLVDPLTAAQAFEQAASLIPIGKSPHS